MKESGLQRFFSYRGSKNLTSRSYPKPQYDTLIESFAGAAGYACQYYSLKVTLCDLSPIICGVWRYLISAKESEIRRIPDRVENVDDIKGCQELKWLVGFWINSCRTSPAKKISEPRNKWNANMRSQIARQLKHIRHWSIVEGSYEDLSNKRATWFIDPPYQGLVKIYGLHGKPVIDFEQLGNWCLTRKGQVIVCENVGADWLPFRPLKYTNAGTIGRGLDEGKPRSSHEAIYTQNDRAHKSGFGLSKC